MSTRRATSIGVGTPASKMQGISERSNLNTPAARTQPVSRFGKIYGGLCTDGYLGPRVRGWLAWPTNRGWRWRL